MHVPRHAVGQVTRSDRIRVTVVLCLLGAGALLALASLAGMCPNDLRAKLSAHAEDGSWSVMTIDGQTLPKTGYLIAIQEGRIRGGRDGCNMWSYETPGSDRIVSDLQGCPQSPVTAAYREIVRNPAFMLTGDYRLRITGRGHTADLRRCKWRTVRRVSPDGVSETRECELQ